MRIRNCLVALYTALACVANPALIGGVEGAWAAPASIADLREGTMKRLALHEEPRALADGLLVDEAGRERALSTYRGQWVVLNFWATWCGPCREEMPALSRLQAELPEIKVLAVATGRNPLPAIRAFYDEAQITNLPVLRDPSSHLARGAGVLALPVTLIVNPDGQEIARLIGDADWSSESAKAILRALIAAAP